jgi:hypothetical protein
VPDDDGWRAYELGARRTASFCRIEHVVPWSMRGATWEPGAPELPPGSDHDSECAACGKALGANRVVIVRHRGAHRIADGFCSVDHMTEWAKAGGRWAP